MEMEESVSFDLLFKDYNLENTETILPLVRKCLTTSQNENEFMRALEIALCFSLKNYSPRDLEEELFQMACPAAKNFVLDKLRYVEKNPAACFEYFGVVLKIITYLQGVFEYLNETEKLTLIEIKSLLTSTSQILYSCYCHCKISENVYGAIFSSATECLSNFFKNCCSLQEQLLDFMTEKSECDTEDDREIVLLDEVLTCLSKSGVVLIHLEVKTMAKVWKTFAGLIQKYISILKNHHNIGETIKELTSSIISNVEDALCKDNKHIAKVIKLSCFLLKLIIKFCEMFKGSLRDCQRAILNLLLLLCRCGASLADKANESTNQEVLNQLTVGVDPLMSQLMEDELLVKECHQMSKDLEKSPEFSILSCFILKKLIDSNGAVRNLWFNNAENILQWIFHSVSSSQFLVCSKISLPVILVNGKQKTFTDLYERVLAAASAFAMTATSLEYRLVEKILIENVLQQHPIRALLATDMWCLLARFAGSELCLSQIVALGNLFQELDPGTDRPEKWYLRSLIRRLFPLLSERDKTAFLKAIQPSVYSALWSGRAVDGLNSFEVGQTLLGEVDGLVAEKGLESAGLELERAPSREGVVNERLKRKVGMLWRFDCEVLSSSEQRVRFFKIICALTSCVVSELPSEVLLEVLSQMKALLAFGQPTPIALYFTWILSALSAVAVPPSKHQKNIITAIADIFRSLLSSREAPTKGKALETFFYFSHVTTHGEIVPSSVQGIPELKVEVANYLKRKPPERGGFCLNEYLRDVCQMRLEHVCRREEPGGGSKRMRLWGGDAADVVCRWTEDARKIMECFQVLSDSERRKIKNVCSSILSLS